MGLLAGILAKILKIFLYFLIVFAIFIGVKTFVKHNLPFWKTSMETVRYTFCLISNPQEECAKAFPKGEIFFSVYWKETKLTSQIMLGCLKKMWNETAKES